MMRFVAPEVWIKLAIGLAFLSVSALFFYFVGQVSTLECSRLGGQPSCSLTTTWMGRYTLREARFVPQGAGVEENCDDEGCTYRVALRTGSTSLPLTEVYSSGSQDKQRTAMQINDFVAGRGPDQLRIEDQLSYFWLALLGVFGLVGLWLIGDTLYKNFRGIEQY